MLVEAGLRVFEEDEDNDLFVFAKLIGVKLDKDFETEIAYKETVYKTIDTKCFVIRDEEFIENDVDDSYSNHAVNSVITSIPMESQVYDGVVSELDDVFESTEALVDIELIFLISE